MFSSLLFFSEWKVERKKPRCPAMTLSTETPFPISMDVVLSLKVKASWPAFTMTGFPIENWLGAKAKLEYKRQPYYVVPKYEGSGTAEEDGVLAKGEFIFWRHIMPCIICHVSYSSFSFDTSNFGQFVFWSFHIIFCTGKNIVGELNNLIYIDTWRLSFSNIEKAIMKNHGSEKTCCEAGGVHCCRLESYSIHHVGF